MIENELIKYKERDDNIEEIMKEQHDVIEAYEAAQQSCESAPKKPGIAWLKVACL